jgi:hypothetical protein
VGSPADFIESNPGLIHPYTTPDAVVAQFPPRPVADITAHLVTGPADFASWELLRQELGLTSESAVDCDVFLWALGEPPRPDMTKVGGDPFRKAGTPWPELEGSPATFVAQINFSDSLDLIGGLPGDLLLVFMRDEFALEEPHAYHFEWVKSGEGSACRAPAPSAWSFVQVHGVRCRSYDDPTMYDRSYELTESVNDSAWVLPVLQGTKIGGTPYDAQTIYPETPSGTRFIAQLMSVQSTPDTPWPWANQQEAVDILYMLKEENQLLLGDLGGVALYLGEDGRVVPVGSTG